MLNLSMLKSFDIVLFLIIFSLVFKEYSVVISNKSVAMNIMC